MSCLFQTPFQTVPFCIGKILAWLCNIFYGQNFVEFQYDFIYLFIYLFENLFIARINALIYIIKILLFR